MIRELIQSAYHPKEISAMFKIKISGLGGSKVKAPLDDLATRLDDKEFCYAALKKVSRSFAAVIDQLPIELRDPICIFYLVLRGLDTIEDDTSFPDEQKHPLLLNFYKKSLDSSWSIEGVGDSEDYKILLANYFRISRSFQHLEEKYQLVIMDICKRMGAGMVEFSEKPVNTIEDYNKYCHYVAGLVGIGLSQLFTFSGKEDVMLSQREDLSNSMGLFLQKTNIVRDYNEDLNFGRSFWPQEVWGIYAETLDAFEKNPGSPISRACLNHMVTNALQHAKDSLEYLSCIDDPKVFRFCAIPQAMAIATLSKVYNNPEVFTGVVKIRKGLTALMMLQLNDYQTLKRYFRFFSMELMNKLDRKDPNYAETKELLIGIISVCNAKPAYRAMEIA